MEIQVGEYVRIAGEIKKIIGYKVGEYIEIYHDRGSASYWSKEGIKELKHSFNIKDLIKKDDYVNGCKVYEVDERGITVYQKVEHSDVDYNWITNDEIKSIVTKEMYESIKYEV